MTTTQGSADPAGAPFRRYLLLGMAVLGVSLAAWRPIPVGVWHDDGVYMLVARALAEGHGFTYQGVAGAPPAVKFPPVYPAVLAGAWATLGEIGAVTLAATLANLVFLALAAALLARGLAVGGSLSPALALLASGLALVSTDVLRTSSAVLSEPLFLALAGACFAVWPEAAREGRGKRRAWLAVLLVLLIGTRAAGLAFVLGFGLAMALARGPRAGAAVAAPALAAYGAWSLWAGGRGSMVQEDLADLLGPYGGWMQAQLLGDPVGYLVRLPAHAAGVVERMAALLLPRLEAGPLWVVAAPLLALTAYGWARSVRRAPPLAWSSALYLGLLLAWPYLDRRLVVPLHMLVVPLLFVGAEGLTRRARSPAVRRAVVMGVGIWVAAYALVGAHRIATEWPTAAYRIRAERLAAAVEAMSRTVPDDAVVGAPEYWAALHLHGGWTVAPSVRFDPGSEGAEAPMWGTPEAQERLWRAAGIDHLLLEQGGLLHGAGLDRLEARCPGMVRILARTPPMLVVRLEWDAPCAGILRESGG